ncbi:MAG: DUF2029 domain-containing protein [Atopobiaceae bacterium]|nr:DUF2029 domain-containing protein [Atopobiaceae bacterium]
MGQNNALSYCRSMLKRVTARQVVALFAVGLLLYWVIVLLSHGTLFGTFFSVYNGHYFGKDFYIPFAVVERGDPWIDGKLNYPAGAVLLMKLMHHIVTPEALMAAASTKRSSAASFYQTQYAATTLFVVTQLLCTIAIIYYVCNASRLRKNSRWALAVSLAFSGPALTLWRSGNISAICYASIYAFLLLRDSRNPSSRMLSYVFLGTASSIKLYPIAFSLLLLRNQDKRRFIYCVLVCMALVFLPFLCFDGYKSIVDFLHIFFQESSSKYNYGVGLLYGFENLIKMTGALVGQYPTALPSWLKYIPVVAYLVLFMLSDEEWINLFAIGMICIRFPSYPFGHTLLLLLPAFVMLLNTLHEGYRLDVAMPALIGALAFLPYALPMVEYVNEMISEFGSKLVYPLSYGHIIVNYALTALFVCCVCHSVRASRSKLARIISNNQNDVGLR